MTFHKIHSPSPSKTFRATPEAFDLLHDTRVSSTSSLSSLMMTPCLAKRFGPAGLASPVNRKRSGGVISLVVICLIIIGHLTDGGVKCAAEQNNDKLHFLYSLASCGCNVEEHYEEDILVIPVWYKKRSEDLDVSFTAKRFFVATRQKKTTPLSSLGSSSNGRYQF